MKDELNTFETYLKELGALKRYDEIKRLSQEVSELKTGLAGVQAERDKLEEELLAEQSVAEEARQLKEALQQAKMQVSMLKNAKTILKDGELTLEEASREFLSRKESEIRARVEKESEEMKRDFESRVPHLIAEKLMAIIEQPEWPVTIARVIEEKVEERVQSKLDDEFRKRVAEAALGKLQELKRTEWHSFVEDQVVRLSCNLVTMVAELQGEWHFTCDRCQGQVTVNIGPREVAILLKGERVAECPQCPDFNPPPAPPITPHKIKGSSLENLLVAYLATKGPLGKDL